MCQRKNVFRIISAILLILVLIPSFSGCAFFNPVKPEIREFFGYFDTFCKFRIDTKDRENLDEAAIRFEELISTYDKLFDIYESHDDTVTLYDVNKNAGKDSVVIDERLFEALEFGKEMHSLTNGACNIAMGSLISLWHEAREYANTPGNTAKLPDRDKLEEAMKHTDISSLVLDRKTLSVKITDPYASLDFGAIAKGYVADIAAELLLDLGYENFLIDLGGNIVAKGKNHKNVYWSAMIENPYEKESMGYKEIIELNDQTLVTSGSYQRFFTVNEKNYSHIIDNESGYPPEFYLSVSVLAPADSSGLADALSTALFCMPLEEGKALVKTLDKVEVLWMTVDGQIEMSDGFGGSQ